VKKLYAAYSAIVLGFVAAAGCGSDADGADGSSGNNCVGFDCNTNRDGGPPPGCVNLECQQAECAGGTKTTLTGRVFDPAGKVPLYNVLVYVPNATPDKITTGLGPKCDRCDGTVSGSPIALTSTDAAGRFTLSDVPAGVDFPLVMQIGKWRRTITIPKVDACTTRPVTEVETRLPRNRREGDIPRIALATGSADPLECLLRKIGLEDAEFATAGNNEASVHLYAGGGVDTAVATSRFASGGNFAQATGLWGSLDELRKYDLVLLSCEGAENAASKSVDARRALYDYAAQGGRVFTSHFHHYWFSNSPLSDVKGVASWKNDFSCVGPSCPEIIPEPNKDVTVFAEVSTAFAKAQAMKDWLKNTGSLTGANDTLPIQEMRHNVDAVTQGRALSWMTARNPAAGNRVAHEYVTFNAPVGAADADVCGRVVYTDLHVGAGDATGTAFPNGCVTADLTPQQKALEFMLFDLSSCIQRDDLPVQLPR